MRQLRRAIACTAVALSRPGEPLRRVWRRAAQVAIGQLARVWGDDPLQGPARSEGASRAFLFLFVAWSLISSEAHAKTILFVGNSFTSGLEKSTVKQYAPDSITDLNGTGAGGVPAIFKTFSEEMGLDYQVSMETVDSRGLDFHFDNDLSIFQRPWDVAVLQDLSMLDTNAPGNPDKLISYSKQIGDVLRTFNPHLALYLNATWSSARLTYGRRQPWYGKPIQQMAQDIHSAYAMAAQNVAPAVVIPVGLAWNRAIEEQVAKEDPDDFFAFSELDLWARDDHHGSVYGYYLEALVIFGCVTGIDPLSLGSNERAAKSLHIASDDAVNLQRVARDELMLNSDAPLPGGK